MLTHITTPETGLRQRGQAWLCRGLLLLAGLLLVGSARAQTGEDALRFTQRFPAASVRMMGLGGAGIAGVADYGALFTNPAGLGYFQRSLLSGSLGTLSVTDEALFQAPGTSNTAENSVRATRLDGLGYVYRVPTTRGSFAIGASFNQINAFDRDLKYAGDNPSNSFTDFLMPVPGEFSATQVAPDYDEELFFGQFLVEDGAGNAYLVDFDPDGDGFINRPLSYIGFQTFGIDFSPALFDDGDPVPFLPAVTTGTMLQAGRVIEEGAMRELNIGGAIEAARNLMLGASLNIHFGAYDLRSEFEEIDERNENDGNFGNTTDFDRLLLTERIESDLLGLSFRAGLSSQIAPNVRAGLTLETPTFYAIDESYSTELETVFDNGDVFRYGGQPDEDVGSGAFEYEITTPWRFGVGLSADVSDLTVLADAEFVDWTQMEMSADVDEAYFEQVNRSIRDDLDAVVNSRFGLEYALGRLTLRGGLAFQPDPRRAETERGDGTTLDRSKTFYSAGFSYRFTPEARFDFGWVQARYADQFLPYTDVTDAPLVDEDVVLNRFAVGLTYRF